MTHKASTALHIGWAPGRVRALDTATGQSFQAEDIAGLGPAALSRRHAIVGVERSLVFLRVLRLPRAAPGDLRRMVESQLGLHFPLPSDQVAFDAMQAGGRSAEGSLTMVAAVRTADLTRVTAELRAAGLTASRIVPVGLGSVAAAARSGSHDALVLEGAPGGLGIDVVQGGLLRVSRMATDATDPAGEVQRTLAALGADRLPILCGPGVSVPDSTPLPVSALEMLADLDHFGFDLPEERARRTRGRTAMLNRAAALSAVVAGALAVTAWLDYSRAAAAVSGVEAGLNSGLSRLRSAESTEAVRLKDAMAARAILAAAFEPSQPVSDLVAVVSDRVPSGVWLTGLNAERGKPLQVRGTAAVPGQVAGLLGAFGTTPRLSDARLVSANTSRIGVTTVTQFSVTALGTGNTPLLTPPKQPKRGSRTAAAAGTPSGGAQQ